MIWKIVFSFLLTLLTITQCGSLEMDDGVAAVSSIPRLAFPATNDTIGGKVEQNNEEEIIPRATEAGTDPPPVVPLRAIAKDAQEQEPFGEAPSSTEAAKNIVAQDMKTASSTDPPMSDLRLKKEIDEERPENERVEEEPEEIYTEPPVQLEKGGPWRRDDGEEGRREGFLRGAQKERNPLRLVPVNNNKDRNEELLDASLRGNTATVLELIRSENVDVNTQNELFWTPIVFAASRGNIEEVRALVEAGADVNHQEKDGWSPIFFAAFQNNIQMCNYLLDEGADILMLSHKGLTVYGAAALDGHTETAIQLSNIALVEALIVGNAQRVLDAVADGADPDATTTTGWTPLIFMVSRSNVEGVKRLLDAGADVNKAENDGWSPLIMSAELGNLELVQIFLEAGADVLQQTVTGRTSLACAESGKHTKIVSILQKAVSSRTISGKSGKRPKNLRRIS